ncbi:putative Ankyrin repeats (many copies) [Trypanosoma vivax]|nr:putative Ankyrin repeats (many copies) [Trypanosoma vivax]
MSLSPTATCFSLDAEQSHVQSVIERMAVIQEEIAQIDNRLQVLRQAESTTSPSPQKERVADSSLDPTVSHMLAVELCQLSASGDTVGVRILLNGGADCDCVDYDSRTPLHLASLKGHTAVVSILLEFGADMAVTDKDGKTPLDLAMENDCSEVVKLLMERSCTKGHTDGTRGVGMEGGSSQSGENEFGLGGACLGNTCPDFSRIPHPMLGSLIVIMVGLPARGKTYAARQIQRYFQWNGLQSAIFTYLDYARRFVSSCAKSQDANMEVEREHQIAAAIARDMTQFIAQDGGVAVLNGSHVTSTRRAALLNAIMETGLIRRCRVVFVEVVNTVSENVRQNVLWAKEMAANAPENFVEAIYEEIEEKQSVYRTLDPVSDRDLTYIRIQDNLTFSLNNISGWMPSRLAYMLHNLNHSLKNIYLTRSGEYVDLVHQRIGGNSPLTERGQAYSKALFEYFRKEYGMEHFVVMSSCALRCTETVQHFEKQSVASQDDVLSLVQGECVRANCRVHYLPTLDDMNHGDCNGMLISDVYRTMPCTLRQVLADPYHCAWPNGECIHQVFNTRLEPVIHDIQASAHPVLVVSHLQLLQGLYSYFVCENDKMIAPQDAHGIEIPLECVVKIRRVGDDRVAEVIDLSDEVDSIQIRETGAATPKAKTRDIGTYRLPP